MKKIIKRLGWILLILFIFLATIVIVANGIAGDKAQYYYLKGAYRLFNPKNKPSAEFVIDLNQGRDFIINNAKPPGWLYPGGWWPEYGQTEQEERSVLRTAAPANPLEYFKVKIIWDETTLTIADTKVISIHFKDYKNSEYRIKHPTAQGINSVEIFCMDGHPALENGQVIQRRMDYDFAFAQHQKLATMLADAKFVRDVHADEKEKNIINKRLEAFGGSELKYLEYKTWIKGNFEFTLILKLYNNTDYMNSIYINPKDKL
jgi:hypothetical protein